MTLRSGRYKGWDGDVRVDLVYDLMNPDMIKLIVADRATIEVRVTKRKMADIERYIDNPLKLMDCFDEDIERKAVPIQPILLLILEDENVIDEAFDTVEEAKAFVDTNYKRFHDSKEWPLEFYIIPYDIRFFTEEYEFPEEGKYIPASMGAA